MKLKNKWLEQLERTNYVRLNISQIQNLAQRVFPNHKSDLTAGAWQSILLELRYFRITTLTELEQAVEQAVSHVASKDDLLAKQNGKQHYLSQVGMIRCCARHANGWII